MSALAIANANRLAIAEQRKRLALGEVTAADVVDYPCFANIPVRELLGMQRRWGAMRVERVMNEMQAFNPTCGGLTPRQRRILDRMCGPGRRKGK